MTLLSILATEQRASAGDDLILGPSIRNEHRIGTVGLGEPTQAGNPRPK